MRNAVVTGIGLLCAIGDSQATMLNNIVNGTTGIKHNDKFMHVALEHHAIGAIDLELNDFSEDLREEKTHLMAKKVIDDALADAALDISDIKKNPDTTGLSVATSVLRVLKMQRFAKNKVDNEPHEHRLLAGDAMLNNIGCYTGASGPGYITSTACSSSAGALGLAKDMIANGTVERVLVVASDPLVDMSIAGFNILQNVSKSVCKPFDKNRDGISLGEAAVCFVVEEQVLAKSRGSKIYGEIKGYGMCNEAYTMTAPDPSGDGAFHVMKSALKMGKVNAEELCYINAHGTGTLLNDAMEVKAIMRLVKDKPENIAVSSTKSFTGHCLASAGAIEAAITIVSLRNGIIPPTVTLESKDDTYQSLNLPHKAVEFEPTRPMYALSNSFAFGGNAASVLLKIYPKDWHYGL